MSDEDLIEAMCNAAGGALRRDAARRVLDVVRPKGWRVVPEDNARLSLSNSTLPVRMIMAGVDVLDRVDVDNANYVYGETTDWDRGMVAAAVYRSMIEEAPSPPLPPKIRDDDPMRETFA